MDGPCDDESDESPTVEEEEQRDVGEHERLVQEEDHPPHEAADQHIRDQQPRSPSPQERRSTRARKSRRAFQSIDSGYVPDDDEESTISPSSSEDWEPGDKRKRQRAKKRKKPARRSRPETTAESTDESSRNSVTPGKKPAPRPIRETRERSTDDSSARSVDSGTVDLKMLSQKMYLEKTVPNGFIRRYYRRKTPNGPPYYLEPINLAKVRYLRRNWRFRGDPLVRQYFARQMEVERRQKIPGTKEYRRLQKALPELLETVREYLDQEGSEDERCRLQGASFNEAIAQWMEAGQNMSIQDRRRRRLPTVVEEPNRRLGSSVEDCHRFQDMWTTVRQGLLPVLEDYMKLRPASEPAEGSSSTVSDYDSERRLNDRSDEDLHRAPSAESAAGWQEAVASNWDSNGHFIRQPEELDTNASDNEEEESSGEEQQSNDREETRRAEVDENQTDEDEEAQSYDSGRPEEDVPRASDDEDGQSNELPKYTKHVTEEERLRRNKFLLGNAARFVAAREGIDLSGKVPSREEEEPRNWQPSSLTTWPTGDTSAGRFRRQMEIEAGRSRFSQDGGRPR